jgi:tetratricopeptide (TPR) repeat protein
MPPNPKVTVLIPTYNRPAYLPQAIRSVIGQQLADWEMFVINDGGVDVRNVVEGFGDERVAYVNRPVNEGKAACLNDGLRRAHGDYVAYLDDDDLWYPNHLAALADVLDGRPQIGVAYSDLYRVVCAVDEQGMRYPLQKQVEICRDYNRMFMFHFNHTLHVSLMHRRELGLRVGGYDESVRVLIDWNLTRKLSFCTDFAHVSAVTGEYFAPVRDSDRISDVQRKDKGRYLQNLRRIRADLPPEPWPKVQKVAVVFPLSSWDAGEVGVVRYFADKLDYPCRIVLVNRAPGMAEPDCRRALGDLQALGHIRVVNAPAGAPLHAAYLAGVSSLEADCYYLATAGLHQGAEVRLIRAISYMKQTGCAGVRWEIDGSCADAYDLLLHRRALPTAGAFFHPAACEDVRVIPDQWMADSLETDLLLCFARECEEDGDYAAAKAMLDQAASVARGGLGNAYLVQRYARVAFSLGDYEQAEQMCRELVARGYGADNWLRLGQIAQRKGDYEEALQAYRSAFESLGLSQEDLERPELKLVGDACDAFRIVIGTGECLVELGCFAEAAPVLRKAARLRANSHLPCLAFGRMFLREGNLGSAEDAFNLARGKECGEDLGAVEAGLAEVYERQGRTSAAYWACRNAMEADPAEQRHVERAARLCKALGREGEMESVYRRFLGYRPGHVQALRGLSEICRRTGRADEARELAERAELLHAIGC